MANRISPYQRLKDVAQRYAANVDFPRKVSMFLYPKARLSDGWSLTDLYERTKAAEQLGYEVIVRATDAGLEIKYQEKRPSRPWELQS